MLLNLSLHWLVLPISSDFCWQGSSLSLSLSLSSFPGSPSASLPGKGKEQEHWTIIPSTFVSKRRKHLYTCPPPPRPKGASNRNQTHSFQARKTSSQTAPLPGQRGRATGSRPIRFRPPKLSPYQLLDEKKTLIYSPKNLNAFPCL